MNPVSRKLFLSAVTGELGGVGKTRAAVEYAKRYAHEYTALLFITAARPHVFVVTAHAETVGSPDPTARLMGQLALNLSTRAEFAEAEPLMRRALAIGEPSYGHDHPDVAIDLNNLAQLLKATNRLATAEPLIRRAAAIFVRSLGAEHPSSVTATGNYARLLLDTGRSEAEIQSELGVIAAEVPAAGGS